MLILLTVVPVIMCILLIRENCKLEQELTDTVNENIELKDLRRELIAENQGYRKVIEKWRLEEDNKNKDYWGI